MLLDDEGRVFINTDRKTIFGIDLVAVWCCRGQCHYLSAKFFFIFFIHCVSVFTLPQMSTQEGGSASSRRARDWTLLPVPDRSRVKSLVLDQEDGDYILMLTDSNRIFCAGSLSTLGQTAKKKIEPLDGPILQFYRSTDADITDIAASQGRVYATLSSGQLLCLEPDDLGHEVRPDGTRMNAAGYFARRGPDGKYYCGRKHSGCRVSTDEGADLRRVSAVMPNPFSSLIPLSRSHLSSYCSATGTAATFATPRPSASAATARAWTKSRSGRSGLARCL